MSPAIQTHRALRSLLVAVHLALSCGVAQAVDRDRTISQLAHRAWTARDGAPSQITSLAQTTDGYLWIGTTHGLFRFDGIRFERYEPQSGGPLQSGDVFCLLAVPDSGLWIGFRFGGISFLKDGHAVNYSQRDGLPPSRVAKITRGPDGAIWAGVQGGLARFENGRWEVVAERWGFTGSPVAAAFVDQQGTLWVAAGATILCLPQGTNRFQSTGEHVGPGQVPQIVQGPGDTVWAADLTGQSIRQIRSPGDSRPPAGPDVRDGSLGILFDHQGALWVTTGEGLLRVRFPEQLAGQTIKRSNKGVEVFNEKQGLSSDFGWPILEDREGNIWVGTGAGLDQFRDTALLPVPFTVREAQFGIVPGDGGDVWTGNLGRQATRIHPGTWQVQTPALPGANLPPGRGFNAGIRDAAGTVWLEAGSAILRMQGGHIARVPWPRELSLPQLYSGAMAVDHSGELWISIDLAGIFHWNGSTWNRLDTPPGFAKLVPLSGFTDAHGDVWFGYGGGTIASIRRGRMQTFTPQDGVPVGSVKAITGDAGTLWIGGDLGIASFDGAHFHLLRSAADDVFGGTSGIVFTASGDLWLGTARGVIHIPAVEVQRFLKNPAYAVIYQLFDERDGLPGIIQQGRPFPTVIQATDGRLWFATTGGVATLDPTHYFGNRVPPPVSIRSIVSDGKAYLPSGSIRLPSHTANLRIDYTALSLAIPERVQFRYMLEGLDSTWQDAGTRRQAFYTNLPPRRYQFRVAACNNDGVCSQSDATLNFAIAPTFYQTGWFLGITIAASAAALWMLFLLRVRRVAAIYRARMEERLAERERIARELHDTLLQSVQGLILSFQAVAKQIPSREPAHEALENALDRADRVIAEGRDRVCSLRSQAGTSRELPELMRRIGEEYSPDGAVAFRVLVAGTPKKLHATALDEARAIAREALANAFQHATPAHVEVEIAYARSALRLGIRDDGCGLDPEILRAGERPGHWGLQGMRERAERLGATLKMWSRPGAGTEVHLEIPAKVAYRSNPAPARWAWWRRNSDHNG